MEPETAEKKPQEEDQEQEQEEITAAQTEEQPMEQQAVGEQPVEEQASEEQPESQDGEQEQEEEEKYIPRLLDAAGNINTYWRSKCIATIVSYRVGNATPRSRDQTLEPESWTVKNMASFLEVFDTKYILLPGWIKSAMDYLQDLSQTGEWVF